MQTTTPSKLRKLRCSDQCHPDAVVKAIQPASKKRKAVHTSDPLQPVTHEDPHVPIPLEKAAMKALQRQNTQIAREFRESQPIRRPATRLAFAERQRRHRPVKPARTYLEDCRQKEYRALQTFASHGGPDIRDLRGCRRAALRTSKNPIVYRQTNFTSSSRDRQSSRMKPTTEGGTSKSLSAYNRAFQQVLVDSNVYPPHFRHSDGRVAPKPKNWDHINEKLACHRRSLSPSKFSREQHESFLLLDRLATNEIEVKRQVIPIIQGATKVLQTACGEIPFNNLDPLVAHEPLVSGNPDFYRGARPEDLHHSVRKDLDHIIVPSAQRDLPILPNHFTAAKGPDGTAAVAGRQAAYDAFFGARAMHALHNYERAEPQFDEKAYTISNVYNDGQLRMYTSHPVKPSTPGEPASYYMNPLRSFSMIDTAETWRTGATHYRNSLDLAEEWRDEAIRGANEIVANRARVGPVAADNTGIKIVSTGSQPEQHTSPMESPAESALRANSEDFETAPSSPGEEEEEDDEEE